MWQSQVLAGKPCQMLRSNHSMKSSLGYQNYTWRSTQTTGIGHDPSGHALWMERRWESQSTSHWCDNVAKKWDSCGVEKVVQTWVSSHLIWLHLGLQPQDALPPHPPMELVPAPRNIQQLEMVHSTTHPIVSLPRMFSISPLTHPYQWHLMEAPLAGIMMMTEHTNWFLQDVEMCGCAVCLHYHLGRKDNVRNFNISWPQTPLSRISKMQRNISWCKDVTVNILHIL
jgi:hypothetical protein